MPLLFACLVPIAMWVHVCSDKLRCLNQQLRLDMNTDKFQRDTVEWAYEVFVSNRARRTYIALSKALLPV